MAVIKLRRDTKNNWESKNPTLASGEIGIDLTQNLFKIGDGSKAWNSLGYMCPIADGSVTQSKLANASVGTNQLEDDCITTNELHNGAVTMDILANDVKSAIPTSTKQSNWDAAYTNSHTHSNKASLDKIAAHPGAAGKYLKTTASGTEWATVSSGSGTVTSVAMSVPTGLSVSGGPITNSGTLALSFESGYSIPTTTKQSNWDTAYGWGNHANAGYKTTDESVKQTNTTTNAAYRLLLDGIYTDSGYTGGVFKSANLTFNPSTKALSIGSGTGTINGFKLNEACEKSVTDVVQDNNGQEADSLTTADSVKNYVLSKLNSIDGGNASGN